MPALGWRCWGKFDVEGRRVTIWRDFYPSGKLNPYHIQTWEHEPNGTSWLIDPRPAGPPADEPRSWDTGRSEAEVLRDGPDYIHINFTWDTEVIGPVHAYFWGDGRYAGAEQLFSARQVKRATGRDGKMGGLSDGLSKGPTLRALYGSRQWTFKVTDGAGKELTVGTFHPPDLAHAIDEYRSVRADIEKLEPEFRTDFETKTRGSITCAAHDDSGSL